MKRFALTPQQNTLLRYLRTRILSTGVCPSYDDMREHLGLASKSGVNRLIVALEERGHIRRIPGRYRAIEVVETADPFDVAREALARVGAAPDAANVARIASALAEARNAA